MRDLRRVALATFLIVSAACSRDEGPETKPDAATDAGTDAAADMRVDPDLPGDAGADMGPTEVLGSRVPVSVQRGVNPDGATNVSSPLRDAARAGRITTADTGFHGLWSHCKQGDFKLYNDRIEACVSNEISSRYETFAGGGLLDVRRVGQTAPDVFDLYTAKVGFNAMHPATVEVVRDGSDGGPAVVRAVGTDMPAAYFVGVAGHQLFTPLGLDVVVEYRLGPGADFVEILTYVTNGTEGPKPAQKGDLLAWGDRTDAYREGTGFGPPGNTYSWMAASGGGYAFAWATPDDVLTSLSASFGDPPWEITQTESVVLQPGDSLAHFGRLFVAEDLDGAVWGARDLIGEPRPPQRVLRVVDGDGAPAVGRRVEVFDAVDRSVTGGTTDADGRVPLSVPDGPHRVEVGGFAEPSSHDVVFAVGATALDVTVETLATLEFQVTSSGAPSPASIVVSSATGRYEGAAWGERNRAQLPPGDWTVTLGRGPEFGRSTQNVTAVAGETLVVTADLPRLMNTNRWLAGDFHQHMEPSSDSRVWVEDRVLDNAAQGVEVLVPTDHDVVTDLGPIIASAGLEDLMMTFPGAELSPALAHTNVYPLPWRAEAPGRGTVALAVIEDDAPRRRTVPELIAAARALPTDPVVQINHPRDSSGLFDLVGFDPEVGPSAVTHAWFTTDFDAMEVSNGNECQQFKDWAGLWNAGVNPTAIGSSDSHGLWGDAGSQRTWLGVQGAPTDVTPEEIRDVVRAGAVVVGTSVFLDFQDILLPGDTVVAPMGTTSIGVRVQSADWVGVREIHVVVNGTVTQVISVTPLGQTLDFVDNIDLTVTEDSWVVFLAVGAASGPDRPSGKLPYAFNNPLRIDFGGDGYLPPGVRALDLDSIPLCN